MGMISYHPHSILTKEFIDEWILRIYWLRWEGWRWRQEVIRRIEWFLAATVGITFCLKLSTAVLRTWGIVSTAEDRMVIWVERCKRWGWVASVIVIMLCMTRFSTVIQKSPISSPFFFHDWVWIAMIWWLKIPMIWKKLVIKKMVLMLQEQKE